MNKKLNEAIQMLKAFNFSLYWLGVLIDLKYINKIEAGYIITLINKGI